MRLKSQLEQLDDALENAVLIGSCEIEMPIRHSHGAQVGEVLIGSCEIEIAEVNVELMMAQLVLIGSCEIEIRATFSFDG